MTENINNVTTEPQDVSEDLIIKSGRFAIFGWVAFFITLLILLGQNIFYALMPTKVMASENGRVIGYVTFDEPRSRSNDDILGDVKVWVARCVSVNKIKIYEDLSICLNHMEPELAEAKILVYDKTGYADAIEKLGCERTNTEYDTAKNTLKRESSGRFEADIYGEVICNDGDKPKSQGFALNISGTLRPKDEQNNLGIKVSAYSDI